MLCLAYECDNVGVLATGGVPWSDDDIAAAVGGDLTDNVRCLHELIEKGVVHRNKSGAVFSRRMVRDEEFRKVKAMAGHKGGSASKGASKSKTQAKGKAKQKQTLSGSDSDSGLENGKGGAGGKPRGDPTGFDEFWAGVPTKVGKGNARRAWEKAIASGVDPGVIVAALPGYVAYETLRKNQDGERYRPLHPATWLNGERWEDQPPEAAKLPPDQDPYASRNATEAELEALFVPVGGADG